MAGSGFVQKALGLFHQGVRAGTGATETVQVAPPGREDAQAPYLRTLAFAGLGGLMLGAVAASPAQADGAGFLNGALDGLFATKTVSLARTTTTSPRLEIFQENWKRFSPDTDFILLDLRDNSATYGQGIAKPVLEKLAAEWHTIDPRATPGKKDATPGLNLSPDPARPNVCQVRVGGEILSGSIEKKLATVAAAFEKDALGRTRMDNGLPVAQAGRIKASIDDYAFDNFVAFHEFGHCSDPEFTPESTGKATLSMLFGDAAAAQAASYKNHTWEVRADVFATLMSARSAGDTRAGEAFADLRAISAYRNGPDPAISGKGDNVGARYYTTPAIDATVAWIKSVGVERVQAMTPEEVTAKANELAHAHALTPEQFETFKAGVADTRLDNGAVVVAPGLEAFGERLGRAMAAQGFVPQKGDVPEFAADKPEWKKAQDALKPSELAALARVDGMNIAAKLGPDMHEGATVVRMDRKGGATQVTLREPDGALTKAVVSDRGDVMRYDANGVLASLSPERPAVQKIGGEIRHRVTIDGHSVDMLPQEVYEHFQAKAAPSMAR